MKSKYSTKKLNKLEKQMKNGHAALLCGLFLLVGIALTAVYFQANPVEVEKEVPVIVNNTVFEKDVEVVGLEKLDQLYKETYSAEYDAIEGRTHILVGDEISEKDLEEVLEKIKNFDEVVDYTYPTVDDKSVDIEVLNIGLENEEDKVADFEIEVPVSYKLTEGQDVEYLTTVMVVGKVVYDEGNLQNEDLDLEYIY